MTTINSESILKTSYFSLQGRCSRQQYWLYGVLPYLVLSGLLFLLARQLVEYYHYLLPFFILSFWPLVTMQVKRYHDLDMSGWFVLLLLLPFVGKVMLIIVGVLPGKPGDNRYGTDLEGRAENNAAPQQLSQPAVFLLFILGFFAYLVFATFTGFDDFDLNARNEERWMMARYLLVTGWLLIAIVIYVARRQQAYLSSMMISPALGLALAIFLVLLLVNSGEGSFALIGTALTYAYVSGMLCMTFKNWVVALVSAVLFFGAQILVDAVVLGIAAEVRMH